MSSVQNIRVNSKTNIIQTVRKNSVNKGNCRFTTFITHCGYKSHLGYRMSEHVETL
jgi:hypothetical protein